MTGIIYATLHVYELWPAFHSKNLPHHYKSVINYWPFLHTLTEFFFLPHCTGVNLVHFTAIKNLPPKAQLTVLLKIEQNLSSITLPSSAAQRGRNLGWIPWLGAALVWLLLMLVIWFSVLIGMVPKWHE